MEYHPEIHQHARQSLKEWQALLKQNPYVQDIDFQHAIALYFNNQALQDELSAFAAQVVEELEPLVAENNYRFNWPRLEKYNGIGERVEAIIHHPTYIKAGNIIYASRMLERLSKQGGLLESLVFFFLSGQAGEAGHNCPFACSAGIIRVLQKVSNIAHSDFYIKKLCEPSFEDNFTGAQFLTEIQGGSDVGQNATAAFQDENGNWRIRGEKWFCSNANADLILMTARYKEQETGTAGLALFLLPKYLDSGQHNNYSIRRLKEKIGTCSMASGEIDFQDALAYPVGQLEEGFKLVMENVLHISRLCNTFCMLGMARRAFYIALNYAKTRLAFGAPIINYPLVQENLAKIKTENDAMLASIFATVHLQDEFDLQKNNSDETKLLLRLLANLNKYISALWSVEHIHHALDTLAGNGAIETFSSLPRLLRDSIVCENWEGTHNTLRMQILRDIKKLNIQEIFFQYIEKQLLSITDTERKKFIADYLAKSKITGQNLLAASIELQTLKIKEFVDQLANIYLATCLLKEGIHQERHQHKKNKLLAYDYFSLLHLQPANEINEHYLKLIQAIINLN